MEICKNKLKCILYPSIPYKPFCFYFDLYNRKPGSNFGGDNFIVRAEGVFLSCRVPIPKYIYKKKKKPWDQPPTIKHNNTRLSGT